VTTQPVMLQPRVARAAFWERFQREVELRVRECNAIAGEPLWVVSGTGEPFGRLTVESVTRPGNRIQCSFDLDRGSLVCSPGPALHSRRLHFRWTEGKLLFGGRECDVDDALNLVLDQLVCIDEE
jgi:hypothetical protein